MADKVNWEKIGVYIAIGIGFLTMITYLADTKERTRALEVEVVHLKVKVDRLEEKEGYNRDGR